MQMYRCSASMATRELLSDWCLSFQRTYWSLISSTECLRRCLLCHVYISHNVKRRQPSSQSSSSSSSFSCWCYLYTLHVLTRSRLIEKAWADLNTGSWAAERLPSSGLGRVLCVWAEGLPQLLSSPWRADTHIVCVMWFRCKDWGASCSGGKPEENLHFWGAGESGEDETDWQTQSFYKGW